MAIIKCRWKVFCGAIRSAWATYGVVSGILAIVVGIIVLQHPEWGTIMSALFLMISLGIFVVFLIIRLVVPLPTSDLLTGTATIEVVISSDWNCESQCIFGTCGHFLLVKGQEVFLTMIATECISKQIGNNEVFYKAVFNLNAMDKSVGKPISYLAEAKFAQIHFGGMPENSRIIRGSVICIFNSSIRVEIPIPPQMMNEDAIIIPEIQKYFVGK